MTGQGKRPRPFRYRDRPMGEWTGHVLPTGDLRRTGVIGTPEPEDRALA